MKIRGKFTFSNKCSYSSDWKNSKKKKTQGDMMKAME